MSLESEQMMVFDSGLLPYLATHDKKDTKLVVSGELLVGALLPPRPYSC
ncbi:hypothetical protein [Scytonema sp. NUACC26]